MFVEFFYLLRDRGLKISLNEWMTLLLGLEKGLHGSSLTGFYQLCRAVLIKTEADFDRFDQVFLEYFKGVPYEGELPEELIKQDITEIDGFESTVASNLTMIKKAGVISAFASCLYKE